jgi:hypothetical protein
MTADPEYKSQLADVPALNVLEERVATIRQLRITCNYASALRLLPDTVRGLHARLNSSDWHNALRLLILAEEAAASIVRYQGTAPAMAMITERMREAARRLEDEVMIGLAAFQCSHASSVCGAYDHSRLVASSAADAISAHSNMPGAKETLGMLMMTAAFACYGEGVPGDAEAYVQEAKQLAALTGDRMTLSLFFGPTNIRLWEMSMEADGGDPKRAVALGRNIELERVPHVQRQVAYHVDTGRALAHLGRDEEALGMLMAAERLAPAHVLADPLVWETARDVVERRKRNVVPSDVRMFCGRLGVAL